jgi:hypothetical protein
MPTTKRTGSKSQITALRAYLVFDTSTQHQMYEGIGVFMTRDK